MYQCKALHIEDDETWAQMVKEVVEDTAEAEIITWSDDRSFDFERLPKGLRICITDRFGFRAIDKILQVYPSLQVAVLSGDVHTAKETLRGVRAFINKGGSWEQELQTFLRESLRGYCDLLCRGEFIEVIGDHSLCWIEIAEGRWVKTEIPNSVLDDLHLSPGRQFLWSSENSTARTTEFGAKGPLGMMQETLREFDDLSKILHDEGDTTEVGNHRK